LVRALSTELQQQSDSWLQSYWWLESVKKSSTMMFRNPFRELRSCW
jgi:rnfA: electron transport complex, RnfABCDGE type, A subunit